MERYKRAERILAKFNKFMSKSSRLEDRIIEMMMRNRQAMTEEEYQYSEPELTEEERMKLEELKKKYLST